MTLKWRLELTLGIISLSVTFAILLFTATSAVGTFSAAQMQKAPVLGKDNYTFAREFESNVKTINKHQIIYPKAIAMRYSYLVLLSCFATMSVQINI